MSRGNPKYTLNDLLDRLEDASPGITNRIPSASKFDFWTDNADENLWVKVGIAKVKAGKVGDPITNAEYPVWVRVDTKNINNLWLYQKGRMEKIVHEKKELARIGTIYSPPFNHLSPIRYAYPSSTDVESLKWLTELKALTMFAFVWCSESDEFIDFKKGEGFTVLLEVLERIPEKRTAQPREKSSVQHREEADADKDLGTGVDLDVYGGTGAEVDVGTGVAEVVVTDTDADTTPDVDRSINGPRSGTEPSSIVSVAAAKKRTYDEFAEGNIFLARRTINAPLESDTEVVREG